MHLKDSFPCRVKIMVTKGDGWGWIDIARIFKDSDQAKEFMQSQADMIIEAF